MTGAAANPSWSRFCGVASRRADARALVQGSEVASFATLRMLAEVLAAEGPCAAVGEGQRVVIWARNGVAMAATILAVWARNGIPILLGPQTPVRHVGHAATVTEAALVIAEAATLETARGVVTCRVAALELPDVRGASAPTSISAATGEGADKPASILFTSGSTGLPKGVVQAHRSLAAGCEAVSKSLGTSERDQILCSVPWGFDYGWGQLLSTFFLGVTHVLPTGPEPFALCEAIARHRPSILASVPSVLAGLTRGVSGIAKTDLSSIRLLTNTGSRIPPDIFRDALSYFSHAAISLNYGLTETYRTCTLDPALARIHPDSVGRAIHGAAVTILDDDGKPVPPKTVGEIVHRGGGVFSGYWGNPEATAKVRRPDPLALDQPNPTPAVYTGDLGYFDEAGLLYLVGRRDRQIKSMGVRVSPEEIETILLSSGLVREAAVLSRKHETIGDQVLAVIAAGDGGDPVAALKRYARQQMSPFMEPRLYFVVDALPRTSSGKVDYSELRRRYAETHTDIPSPMGAMS